MVHEDQLRCPLCGQPYTPDTPGAPADPRASDRWTVTPLGEWHEAEEGARRRGAERMVSDIPTDELPDAADRATLVEDVISGLVEHIYQPVGARYTNLCIAGLPPYVDQRLRVSQWLAWRREGRADMHSAMLQEYERRTAAAVAYSRDASQAGKGAEPDSREGA